MGAPRAALGPSRVDESVNVGGGTDAYHLPPGAEIIRTNVPLWPGGAQVSVVERDLPNAASAASRGG